MLSSLQVLITIDVWSHITHVSLVVIFEGIVETIIRMSVTLNILAVIDNATFIEIHLTASGHWKNRVTMWLQYFIYININFISSNKRKSKKANLFR